MTRQGIQLAGLALLAGFGLLACGADTSNTNGTGSGVQATIDPTSVQLVPGDTTTFLSGVTGTVNVSVTWSVVEAGGGSIDTSGRYTAPGSTGTYHVRVQSVAEPTAVATAVVVVTTAPIAAPAAPTGAVASSPSSTSIQVSWTDNATNETGYLVERSASSSSGFAQVGTAAANATSYTDAGLTASTTYYYRVRATNAGGQSAYSNVASATTQASSPPPTDVAGALAVLAGQAVFFDHASVGNNTMYGVERLFTSAGGAHPTRNELGQAAASSGSVSRGVWADHYFLTDNGYPLQKMAEFRDTDLGSSGVGTRLNSLGGVAMMKLCFADFDGVGAGLTTPAAVDAAFATYQSTMSQLQAAYPNVKFVHMTAALRDGGNEMRERYNGLVRNAYGSTGRMFDLADVESNGYTVGGFRALNPVYNRDGGHLTVEGQDAVARALVLFVAGLFP
jgi:hypothetical protein